MERPDYYEVIYCPHCGKQCIKLSASCITCGLYLPIIEQALDEHYKEE